MKSELRAGWLDVKRTRARRAYHLRLGDWAYKLGYLAGWVLTRRPDVETALDIQYRP